MLSNDGHLVRQCLNGDAAAFGILVDRYRQSVFGLAFSRLSNFQEAEDIAQEAFLRAYQKLRSLKQWDSFAAWLYSITVNLCRKELKVRARRPDREYLGDQYIEAVDHSIQAHEQQKVQRMVCESLAELPEMYREVLSLYYLVGMRSNEIAEFLGARANTIDQRLHRARGMLKDEMLAVMRGSFAEAKMQRGFTLQVMELAKRIPIRPVPYTKAIPWIVSATGGILLTALMFWGTFKSHSLFARLDGSSLQSEMEVLDIGEIPVAMDGNNASFFPNALGNSVDSGFHVSFYSLGVLSAPEIDWTGALGGADVDRGHAITSASDGGYTIAGMTISMGQGMTDIYLAKTDSSGQVEWQRTYGGPEDELAFSVNPTADGGYIIGAYTKSFGVGSTDAYLIKTNASGVAEWDQTYGGMRDDVSYSAHQTRDGGYISVGYTASRGAGSHDAHLIKTDASGKMVWEQTFGGTEYDIGRCVQQTRDGGYVITGETHSFGAGVGDIWLLKTDTHGVLEWQQTFGGANQDEPYSVHQTMDGGYIIAGYTGYSKAGTADVCLIRTDSLGQAEWQQTYGGSDDDIAHSVQQTADGGYIVTGYTKSQGAGSSDVYLLRTDASGEVLWEETYGGIGSDIGWALQETDDHGYIIAGQTDSSVDGEGSDVYVVKVSGIADIWDWQ